MYSHMAVISLLSIHIENLTVHPSSSRLKTGASRRDRTCNQ